ncbi:hypothetical protein KDN24_07050 [Bacillus sp. Bva_UNVM-123]|uniref:hypothetical protein n=1 Tax=Bacillus sp. Bva_UNVM-123 TaxID=2829798 RepID=UPI00391FBD6A
MPFNEYKLETLLSFVSKLEEQIGEISLKLEFNRDIKDLDWDEYEVNISNMYNTLRLLKEEINY